MGFGFSSALHSIIHLAPVWWMVYDVLVAAGAVPLAFKLRGDPNMKFGQLVAYPVVLALVGNILGLYDRGALHGSIVKICALLVVTAVTGALGMVVFSISFIYAPVGNWVLLYCVAIFLGVASPLRVFGYMVAKYHKIRVLLVSDRKVADIIGQRLAKTNAHYDLVGHCCEKTGAGHSESLGSLEDIPRICEERGIHQVVITSHYVDDPRVLDHSFETVQLGCSFLDECTFYERAFELVLVDQISRGWFYSARLGKHNNVQAIVKRVFDIVIASVCLVLTAPLFPFIWVLVRAASFGPAFYSQVRCGRFDKPFNIYKFRTMTVDAEPNGAQWASQSDSRITPIGRVLRKTRLDEIPQFWNILKGDMSFVGPRPERPELVKQIEHEVPFFVFRHWARPGLTGWAQIRYRYGASVEDAKEKLHYDLYYIKHWSLLLDIRIILRTFSSIMKGAR